MADLFWFSDAEWAVIEPFMPQNQPGAHRVDDRRVISGIVHVLRSGCRWRDCPAEYGPPTTVYNRFNRWSRRGFWRAMLATLAERGWIAETASLDSTYVRAHRSAHGGEGGQRPQAIGPSRGGQTTKIHVLTDVLGRPAVIHLTPGNASDVTAAPDVLAATPGHLRRLVADRGYDADALRRDLRAMGTKPVIPGRRCRKRPIRHDKRRYRDRWRIEAAICRLKDFRRIGTRYDKLAANFDSAVAIAAIVAFWC
ncbi:IS5 family transposase [Roseomonas sp. SSH11]|uniref:IS5 family transposase n=1 Tax=Pararoseomonas baculiformis TaxID=2820812 RepID=A0ABS4AIZ5_9PROT|nr:IS5 family transposase [Pararoseomonas baculiformis]MBP0446824.1 IS5 family transposase [Pararoseomonas baculiformis]